jgi:nucleoside-diphosphate-sugar epimerase
MPPLLLVQKSVSMLYPDRGDAWIDESIPTDRYPMARANLTAESNANRFSANGRVGVVLRFGWLYGPGAKRSEEFLALAHRHVCMMMGAPDGYVSSIHMTDAGNAVMVALNAPAGTFNVVDDKSLRRRLQQQDNRRGYTCRVDWRFCWVIGPHS